MRLIDADAAIERLREVYCYDCNRRKGMKNGKMQFCYGIGDVPCRACEMDDAISAFECAPTVDAVPVVPAKWVFEFDREGHYHCSACGAVWGRSTVFFKYCPTCGAKMGGEADAADAN